ncbi:uncharacterized protein BDR25DRAFT_102767 [Lindgomyces ingoldianus]|uniref:Uncharacterized protein n=1 Tax=Lindgomyces ingoldianus TaxID=673940 RepID=A0ACB6R801_9PLEO|nr:uncharacterized protein BDR25DRAFT_102767 [Lindgomyces ingoldianus]KAF2475443.1 hypothetical protein BDR25DRAFT_102767 [Lindgomyces ingoldianus]
MASGKFLHSCFPYLFTRHLRSLFHVKHLSRQPEKWVFVIFLFYQHITTSEEYGYDQILGRGLNIFTAQPAADIPFRCR